jgi:stage II sporulation protein R
MRKKTIVWAYLILLSLGTILSLYIPKNEVAAKDAVVIPGQAIRLRILANSDLDSDQALKRKVRDAVNAKISVWVKDLTSIKEARKVIKSKLPEIETTAEAVVKEEGSKQKVNVKFGKVQFPTKLYGQFLYPAGDYEAILITLGEGKGANWWCVLFPPLCFLDFSNGIAVSKGFDEQQPKAEAKEKPKSVAHDASEPEVVQPDDDKAEKAADVKAAVKQEAEAEEPIEAKSKNQTASKTSAHGKSVKAAVLNMAEKEMQADEETQSAVAFDLPAKKEQAPVYTSQDEEPVKVKFFVVELWDKIF